MRLRAVLVAILVVLAAGCGQQRCAAQADLDAAQTWVEGYLAAMGADVAAAAPYVADEVWVESGYTHKDELVGRSRYLEMGQGRYGGSGGEVTPGAIYVGESGAVVVSSRQWQWLGDRFVHPFLSHVVIGAEGIEARYDRDSTSLLTLNPYGDADRRALPDAVVGEDIAAAAVESWADAGWSLDRAGEHHIDGPRYDPDAPAVYIGLGGRFADELGEVWMSRQPPFGVPGTHRRAAHPR